VPPPEVSVAPSQTDRREEIVERGTGVFTAPQPTARGALQRSAPGEVNLRFDGADLREFIDVVLGDILRVNYVVDQAVTGEVTVNTSRPITEAQVLPLFEQVLALNGAALVRLGTLYQVLPSGAAQQRNLMSATLPGGETPGFRTQIIPLEYVSAAEMREILESVVSDPAAIQIDPVRNLVFATGSAAEVENVLAAIEIFDVDWLRGMSVGLYPLDNVDPETLADELYEVLGDAFGQPQGDALGGQVRLVALERLTSLLVVSSTPAALREVELWIRRLDRPGESAGRRLYVYPVQNAKAEELADILGSIFGSRGSQRNLVVSGTTGVNTGTGASSAATRLAPGLTPAQVGQAPSPSAVEASGRTGSGTTATTTAGLGTGAGLAIEGGSTVEIIADQVRNALVILASAQDYRMVESALTRLDVVPLQVLIEASIVEVTLRDDLSYGVEWFFRNSSNDETRRLGSLDLGGPGIVPLAPGFSYSVVDNAERVRLALNLLASESALNVLSSPSLMVLDNQTATISVGDEIPIPSRQSISNLDPSAPTVNEISFRQTGVTLSVTPRVNNSGLVTMEIRQEVASAATTTTSNIDAPTIQNRQIESVVAINSGDTIVLGGLMQDQKSTAESGLPFLHRVPGLGKLFGRTANEHARTELLVLITPRVVRDRSGARSITEEYRRKLQQIEGLSAPAASGSAPAETPPDIAEPGA
jgi:general secretion pathway protein D